MSLKSVYLPAVSFHDNRIRITDEEHHHLVVGRAEPGELIEVFDGKGNVWTVAVETVSKRETVGVLKESRTIPQPSVVLILGIAVIRTAAFELALEKAVEIGVTRVVPFTAARSNAVAGNRRDRWSRLVIEAAKQSKRYHVPAIEEVAKFDQVLAIPASTKIMFAERDGGPLRVGTRRFPCFVLDWARRRMDGRGNVRGPQVWISCGVARSGDHEGGNRGDRRWSTYSI